MTTTYANTIVVAALVVRLALWLVIAKWSGGEPWMHLLVTVLFFYDEARRYGHYKNTARITKLEEAGAMAFDVALKGGEVIGRARAAGLTNDQIRQVFQLGSEVKL